ncbi:hypothetical protein BJY04DRAFT_222528 [Aspergillus karnatakaensis]|uniref:uncharacterized protein n=1 Tax=Aspergillus karnatakaensis TaxID=1810916 RepID=UPI003CCD6EAE
MTSLHGLHRRLTDAISTLNAKDFVPQGSLDGPANTTPRLYECQPLPGDDVEAIEFDEDQIRISFTTVLKKAIGDNGRRPLSFHVCCMRSAAGRSLTPISVLVDYPNELAVSRLGEFNIDTSMMMFLGYQWVRLDAGFSNQYRTQKLRSDWFKVNCTEYTGGQSFRMFKYDSIVDEKRWSWEQNFN